jgi:hypothetical protein
MNSYVNEYLAVAQVRRVEEAARRLHGRHRPSYGGSRRKRRASLVR